MIGIDSTGLFPDFEAYRQSFVRGLDQRVDGKYVFKGAQEQTMYAIGVTGRMKLVGEWLRILNSQLVLNVVVFSDAATISDAEPGVCPPIMENVFRLAVEAKVWTGK